MRTFIGVLLTVLLIFFVIDVFEIENAKSFYIGYFTGLVVLILIDITRKL